MDRARWLGIRDLYHRALETPEPDRLAWLRRQAVDERLRREVESLIQADLRAGTFLEPVSLRGLGAAAGAAFPEVLAEGARVGSYEIRGVLGAGGMGVVYLAEQPHPRRLVALKLIRPGLASPRMLRRFEHEAEVLGRLQHAGIGQIFEAGVHLSAGPHGGEEVEQPFCAMEHIEGPALTQYAILNELDLAARARLFVRLCEAVDHAHRRGVLHLDLKPSNILVVDDARYGEPQPKVLDFGVARITDAPDKEVDGGFVGTPAYTSPEQIPPVGVDLDARADVFSLGVVFQQLCCGKLPYEVAGLSPGEIFALRRTTPARRLRALDPRAPADLDAIVSKALSIDRDARYSSARELAEDVQRFLDHQPVLCRVNSSSYLLRKLVARHRLAAGLVALLLLVLVGAVAVIRWQRDEARVARDAAEQVAAVMEGVIVEVDPDRGGSRLMRSMLERSSALLDGRLDQSPVTRARLLAAMGRVHGKFQEFDRAIALYEEAVALTDAAYGRDHSSMATVLAGFGQVLEAAGQDDEAVAHLREALRIRRTQLAPDDPLIAETHAKLGAVYHYSGQADAAIEQLEAACRVARSRFGDQSPEHAEREADLGFSMVMNGRPTEGLEFLQRALVVQRRTAGHEENMLRTMQGVAHGLHATGRTRECEEVLAERAAFAEEFFDVGDPRLAGILHDYGTVLSWRDLVAGIAVLERAVRTRRLAYGDGHPEVALSLQNLAAAVSKSGDHARAVELMEKAVESRRALGELRSLNDALVNLSLNYVRAGRLTDAERTGREALESLQRESPLRPARIATARQNYAQVLIDSGDPAGAEQQLRAALEGYDEGDHARGGVMSLLAGLRLAAGDFGGSVELSDAAIEIYRAGQADPYAFAHVLLGSARARMESGDFDTARAHLEEAQQLAESLDPRGAVVAAVLRARARLEWESDAPQRARALLAEVDQLGVASPAEGSLAQADLLFLAGALARADDPDLALEALQSALRIYEDEAPRGWQVARARHELSYVLVDRGEVDEGEQLRRAAAAELTRIYGAAHRWGATDRR